MSKVRMRFRKVQVLILDLKDPKRQRVGMKVWYMINIIRKCQPDIVCILNPPNNINNFDNGFTSYKKDSFVVWISLTISIKPLTFSNAIIFKEIKLALCDLGNSDESFTKFVDGDWNIGGKILWTQRSDNFKRKFTWNLGDDEKDIGFMGKVCDKNILSSFDNNKMFSFIIARKVPCSIGLRLGKVKANVTHKAIGNILDGRNCFKDNRKIVKKFFYKPVKGPFDIHLSILSDIVSGNLKTVFKCFNALWTGARREPFLGYSIPDEVVDSYKRLLKHDDNKKYFKINIPVSMDTNLIPKGEMSTFLKTNKDLAKIKSRWRVYSSSEAANFDMFKIKDILKGIKIWLEKRYKGLEARQTSAIKNFQDTLRKIIFAYNDFFECNYALTFFLLKDAKLKSANDVRMIMLTPTFIKIYEVFIYKEVSDFIEGKFGRKSYQCGAHFGSSTFQAMVRIRDIAKKFNATGILCLDIAKGYESVRLDRLKEAVDLTLSGINNRVEWLLDVWILMVQNMDILIAGNVVKKTVGIPMGLILSPLMFILYVDYALKWTLKDFLTMFIDDINIAVGQNLDVVDSVEYVQSIIDKLASVGLTINLRKAVLITDDIGLGNKFRKKFSWLRVEKEGKFLGKEILFLNGNLCNNEAPLFLDVNPNNIKLLPEGTPLFIKQLLFVGAIECKTRYKAIMWNIGRLHVKDLIIERAFNFFKNSFVNFERINLLIFSTNYLRLFLDMATVRDWFEAENKSPIFFCRKTDEIVQALHMSWMDQYTQENRNLLVEEFTEALILGSMDIKFDNEWDLWKSFTKECWKKFVEASLRFYAFNDEGDGFSVISLKWWLVKSKFIKKFAFLIDAALNRLNVYWIIEVLNSINNQLSDVLQGHGWKDVIYWIDEKFDGYQVQARDKVVYDCLSKITWISLRANGMRFFDEYWQKKIGTWKVAKSCNKGVCRGVIRKLKEICILIDMFYNNKSFITYSNVGMITLFNAVKFAQKELIDRYVEVLGLYEYIESLDNDNYGDLMLYSDIDIINMD